MRTAVLVGLLFVFAKTTLLATHIVGGEITYRCLSNELYEITLTVYRDCYNGVPDFDNPAIIGVYENSPDSILIKKLSLGYNTFSNDTLPVVLNNPCLTAPPNVCVHKATYRIITTLPFNPVGYLLVYQRCCRNRLIRNLPDPLNTGISFVAEISPEAQMQCNDAATFINWPPVAICVHQPIDFDHSATDPDGDSLAYRLCTPYNGPDSLRPVPNPPYAPPFEELLWLDPPYNLSNLLGGDPLTIDPMTGFMTGIPHTIGNFVVGVCVDEFRNGALLSTTRRDFQYNVADCGEPNAAFFLPDIQCDDLTVQFINQSANSSTFQWYFDWENDLSATATSFSTSYTYPDTGLYTVALIAAPGLPCADTFFQQIHLLETTGTLLAGVSPPEIMAGESAQLNAELPGAEQFVWSPGENLSDPTISNPVATPPKTTTFTVIASFANGCSRADTVLLRVIPPPCDEPYLFFPTGFSPNGDGENDVLQLESNIELIEVYWAVYNRWGEKVFEANRLSDAWDGAYRGQEQPMETYGYVLRVLCSDGQPALIRQGNVTLLR
ncbi:MAG: gliding motility-associated C-terminal domain-containing protein [Saprospiraceae bacterium]|nr:gliding motility-associated C-terminal domain-containing protein [Saprospiraceae bacterium]